MLSHIVQIRVGIFATKNEFLTFDIKTVQQRAARAHMQLHSPPPLQNTVKARKEADTNSSLLFTASTEDSGGCQPWLYLLDNLLLTATTEGSEGTHACDLIP